MERPRFCMHCGTPLGENMRFCPTCGSPIPGIGNAGNPAAPAPGPAQEIPQVHAAPVKKRRTPLIIALLAAAVILLGVGGYFLGRASRNPEPDPTASADRKNSSGEKSTAKPEDAEDADKSAALDPAAAALAIAEKEFGELIAGITEERIAWFSAGPEVMDTALGAKLRMSAGIREIRLYSVTRSEGFRLSGEELFQSLIAAVTAGNNACGITTVQASSIIQKLNPDNSYCFPGDADENTLYLAELRNDKTVTACVICLFNGHHGIMTQTIPVFTEEFAPRQLITLILSGMTGEKKPAVERLQRETLPLKEKNAGAVLARLTPLKAGTEKVEALIEEMAGKATEHAGADYLQAVYVPESMIPLCEACSVFGNSPKLTMKWDLSGLETDRIGELLSVTAGEVSGFSDEALRNMLLTNLPQIINGRFCTASEIAAASVISAGTSASGLKSADTGLYWLFYETDGEKTVALSVSVIENRNGCYDVSAVPIYSEELISLALEREADGRADLQALIGALAGD